MTAAGPLVISTRPAARGRALHDLLSGAGIDSLAMPVMDTRAIEPTVVPESAELAIFVSPAAVAYGIDLVTGQAVPPLLVAVGARTAAALEERGFPALVSREGADSEAVLALPEVASLRPGARVTLVRGVGGRELLRETLVERGMKVCVAEVYERTRPAFDPTPLARALQDGREVFVLVTSVEGLLSLLAGLEPGIADAVRSDAVLMVYSERIAERARETGFVRPVVVVPPGDDAAIVARVAGASRSVS